MLHIYPVYHRISTPFVRLSRYILLFLGLAGLGSGGVVIPIRRWARSRPEDRGAGRQSFPRTFYGPGAAPQARPAALRGLGGLHTPRQAPFPALWPAQALRDPLRARWAHIRQLPGAGHRSSCPRPQNRPTGSPWRRGAPQTENHPENRDRQPRPIRAECHTTHPHPKRTPVSNMSKNVTKMSNTARPRPSASQLRARIIS